ncbi:MAG: hypothetical protein BTN85_1690 [Candidatus Methanohalarchaeum thermophilum]|uniref:Uncharacterized protein n=1 Tax=Methanohalarchaeum thermophilum TaxID=1903181 RepID=A0A1Q6DXZ3_METT1|nr:MAG: hypothetical protein BTN85_1690 [Candidatus Methanohalarchaeum thermophilum]
MSLIRSGVCFFPSEGLLSLHLNQHLELLAPREELDQGKHKNPYINLTLRIAPLFLPWELLHQPPKTPIPKVSDLPLYLRYLSQRQ